MSRSKEQWSRILDEFDGSGMSQQAYAKCCGLKVATFRYKLYRRAKLQTSQPERPIGRFQEVTVRSGGSAAEPCRLRVDASGVHVSGATLPSPEWVAALVRELAAC
jgi:hypothetical protein